MPPPGTELRAGRSTYLGLFLVTLGTLMLEILLTRIFSVTMWYHFAFLAISVAMFGMTAGAIAVYIRADYFAPDRSKEHLTRSAYWFALATIIGFVTFLCIPFVIDRSLNGLFGLCLIYLSVSVPFFFSGICVSIAMTRFPSQVGRLYATDLAGAAAGCLLFDAALRVVDGVTAVFLVAFVAAVGAAFFALGLDDPRLTRRSRRLGVALAAFIVTHAALVESGRPLVRLTWVKGQWERVGLYEKWNSFSRVKVSGNSSKPEPVFGWGFSPTLPPDVKIAQLMLLIDASAYTVLTRYDSSTAPLDYLKYDIVNTVHHLRGDANVLVIGAGGGRDVLSALTFNQRRVTGVEINNNILAAVNRRFGEFTGHLDRDPRVRFVNDEARSWVARSREKFDIIQVSLIDSWAATAAGAFVLSENSLYTTEAWRLFLRHLTPRGLVTFSRWYFPQNPAETYRLLTLARAALEAEGVRDARRHIVILRNLRNERDEDQPTGVGTILVSRQPFSPEDVDELESLARRMRFDLVLTPRFSRDSTFETLASAAHWQKDARSYVLDIAPPTDDRPFFFHMLRVGSAFHPSTWRSISTDDYNAMNLRAVMTLAFLLIIVVSLTVLCILGPVWTTTRRVMTAGSLPLFIFFTMIGLGFMLVEISQMQRLIVFLGHPTYGLAVVLFSLLLSSGLGSMLTNRIKDDNLPSQGGLLITALLGILVLFGLITPAMVRAFESSVTPVRIGLAVANLFPLGIFMGMCFPLGMRLTAQRAPELSAWFWGINGATSVCASVLAVVISLQAGISATYWLGLAFYAMALSGYVVASRYARAAADQFPKTTPVLSTERS
jgi:hypothetical protein